MARVCWSAIALLLCACSGSAPPPAESPAAGPGPADGTGTAAAPEGVPDGPLVEPEPPPRPSLQCPGVAAEPAGRSGGVEGRLDPGPVRAVVDDNLPDLTACYERAALHDARSGRITISWTIGSDGRVVSAEVVDDPLALPGLPRCLLAEICTWQFPAPGNGPVIIRYPFNFDGPGF